MPVLAAAGIPYFGATPLSPDDFTSPDSYPIADGLPIDQGSITYNLAKHGCKQIALIYDDTPQVVAGVPNTVKVAVAMGAEVVAKIVMPNTAVSAAAQVSQAISAGATCIGDAALQNQTPAVILAAKQSGHSLLIGAATAVLPNSVLKDLGSNANGVLLSGPELIPTDTWNPQIRAMLAATKTYEANSTQPYSPFAVLAWAGAELLFKQVIPAIKGDVTASAVRAGIEALKDAQTGVTLPFTASAPAPLANFPRLRNYGIFTWVIKNVVPVPEESGFVNLAPYLQ